MYNNDLTASDNLKFRFATDGEGNHGYLGADDSFIPFSSGIDFDDGTLVHTSNDFTNPALGATRTTNQSWTPSSNKIYKIKISKVSGSGNISAALTSFSGGSFKSCLPNQIDDYMIVQTSNTSTLTWTLSTYNNANVACVHHVEIYEVGNAS